MENQNSPERTAPVHYGRGSRAFRQFKNPPQPHMCIQDTIKDTSEKLYINVLGWQKIANPKQLTDPIPLYGGMQIPQGCAPNSNKPPLLVFAVMVNPDILKQNGKNAVSASDKEALVSLLCDFIEAMNPGLRLARAPVVLRDRDLAGELKDVWLAVQAKREREKGLTSDVMYKVYDIDGIGTIGNEDNVDEETNSKNNQNDYLSHKSQEKKNVKSSKQILMNAGQKSEFDSGMNNCQLNQNNSKDNRNNKSGDITYCTPVYGQIVSTRENHNEIDDIQQKIAETPSSSFRKDGNMCKSTPGWDEFSKRNMSSIKNEEMKKQRCFKTEKMKNTNGKNHYNFFPYFDNKDAESPRTEPVDKELRADSKIIVDPMQNLVLHSTDNKLCDNKALSSIET